MILVDMNQITIGAIMAESKGKPVLNTDLIRHMVINNLRMLRTKFHEKYGELVICYDYPHSWRKDFFPNYKEARRRNRKNSDFDWSGLFKLLNEIRDELKENFPYRVLSVANCEADDVIAVLAMENCAKEPILIVSSDGDFQQLQKYPNIDQYSPLMKKIIKCDDSEIYLFEHVIRGDASDGIPNILSPDDVFIRDGVRQSSISKKKYEEWLKTWNNSGMSFFRDICSISQDPQVVANINRNITLIAFDSIPKDIRGNIVKAFDDSQPAAREKIMNYFMNKGMRNLIQYASEF